MRAKFVHLGFVLAGVLFGCMHVPTPRTARTVGRGNTELGAAFLAKAAPRSPDGGGGPSTSVQVGVDYGVANWADLTARVMPLGGELGAKLQLVRSGNPAGGIDLACSPSVGARRFAAEYAITYFGRQLTEYPVDAVRFEMPFQLGVNLGPRSQLILGAAFVAERYWLEPSTFEDENPVSYAECCESIPPFNAMFAQASLAWAVRTHNITWIPQISLVSLLDQTWRGLRPIKDQPEAFPRTQLFGTLGLAWGFGQDGP